MKCIIDTNVELLAGTPVSDIPFDQLECAKRCNDFIKNFISDSNSKLVLDADLKIWKEYRTVFNVIGNQPSLATAFFSWVCQYMSNIDPSDFIKLQEVSENNYKEYPNQAGLEKFDPPDRKFIALANAHNEKPPIVEGADCKWWGIKDALSACGIQVQFLCEEYIEQKYKQKIGL